jgi:hypothetical protein
MPPDPLDGFRHAHGLEQPGATHWTFTLGPFTIRLRNFAWRRAAIDAHDRHHLITGYPLTIAGEIQMAAWEWGAGRYPDWRATAFCAPLIVAGALVMPRQTWRAYRTGLLSKSFYPSRRTSRHSNAKAKNCPAEPKSCGAPSNRNSIM